MSVVVCQSPALASFHFENEGVGSMVASANIPSSDWRAPARQRDTGGSSPVVKSAESRPGQFDIWSMIQSQKASAAPPPEPYVPPLLQRSSGLMSQKSLEMCTENLGSESGYDDFSSLSDDMGYSSSLSSETEEDQEEEEAVQEVTVRGRGAGFGRERAAGNGRKELSSVNYHCSVSRRSPHRSFPPPLPSLTRRDGPCLHMRSHRRDGRLVVEAVPAPSQNYLHARRQDGRLLLSFIDTTFHQPDNVETPPQPPEAEHVEEEASTEAAPTPSGQVEERQTEEMVGYEEEEEEDGDGEVEEEEEEEEEVEVVDRGTVVEVKVSTQPQQQSGAMRVRSSLVINKFVGGMPLPNNQNRWPMYPPPPPPPPGPPLPEQEDRDGSHAEPTAPPRRPAPTTTTAAAAAAVASSMSAASEAVGYQPPPPDNKLLFTSNRRNREEMLHHMRRCSQLRQPLFFWETCCIATSS